MDETLQRRLVGAFVLLGAAFVVASALPDRVDAPRAQGRVVTYDLETGNEIIAAHAPGPVEPPAEPKLRLRTADRLSTVAKPAEPVTAAPPAAAATTENWYVQIGSFGNPGNARAVVQKLRQKDWPVALEPIQGSKGVLYRVRVGPYPTEARGKAVLASMGKEGFREARLVHE